jgi:MFS family permease
MEAFIFVPLMPILIEALVKEEQKKVGASKKGGIDIHQFSEDEMSDKASSLFQCAQSVGCILGPVLGGFLNDLVRFQSTCDIMAITCFGYACLLYYGMRKDGKNIEFAWLRQLVMG